MTSSEYKEALENYKRQGKVMKEATSQTLLRETTTQQEARIKRLLKPENYLDFFDFYLGAGSPSGVGTARSAKFQLKMHLEVCRMPVITQIRQIFRGAGKSIHANIGNPLQLKQNDNLFFMILIGINEKKAKLLLADLQKQLQFNARIINDFGEQISYGNWADGEFETNDGKYFLASGIDQPVRGSRKGGHRIDYASVDDCEDRDVARNSERVQQRVDKILGDLDGAFDKDLQRLVMPNNYIVKNGLLDGVKESLKDSPYLKVHTVNIVDKHGNPTWPEYFTKEDTDRIEKKTNPTIFQRERMNNPIEVGRTFKKEWIKWVKVHGNFRDWNGAISTMDMSIKKTGDYKAGWFMAFGKGKIHVLDVFCRKCENHEIISWYYERKMYYDSIGIPFVSFYDATASQEEIYSPLFDAEQERIEYFSKPLPDHQSGDKHERISATLSDVLFNGLLVFDEKLKDTPDMNTAMDQILGFEVGTKGNDDAPDALERGVSKGRLLFSLTTHSSNNEQAIIGERNRGGF